MVFCADIAALSKHCKEESASLILSRVLLPQTGQRIHSALLFISIRHLTDNTIKVNEIPVGIIPNSLKIRRVFNTVLRTLIVITNRRPRIYSIFPSVPWAALSFVVKEIISYCSLKVNIQHVGSTSILSIKAKPIIDIVIAVDKFDDILAYEKNLKTPDFIIDRVRRHRSEISYCLPAEVIMTALVIYRRILSMSF